MNRTREWAAVLVGAAAGILLTSCKGETEKSADSTRPPATVVPASDTVVYREPFSSPAGQEWLKSRYDMSTHFDDADLAWKNVVNNPKDPKDVYRIIESGCTNMYGEPIHCHLKVVEVSAGNSEPIRTLTVTPGSKAKAYDINIRTQGDNEQTEFMICKDVEEVNGNDQRIKGACEIYPVRLEDNLDPAHEFCAHTERDLNKEVVIWFEYGHKTCSDTSGPIHNGTGHTHPNKK
jgi:hypothetical protein